MSDLFETSSRAAQTVRDLAIHRRLHKRSPRTRCSENNSDMQMQSPEERSFTSAQDDGTL
jgi:hypothetical protein